MTNYRRRLDLERKTLCLSCCKEMTHGYCQACWEQESRRQRQREIEIPWSPNHANLPIDDGARRYCRACGQWRELTAGQCECGTEKR